MKQDLIMNNANEDPLPPGTELESDEEVERVLQELRRRGKEDGQGQGKWREAKEKGGQGGGLRGQEGEGGDEPECWRTGRSLERPFRPTMRPAGAILIMCDDGENTGEVFRLRSDRFIIGRTEGDLQLPDDEQISSRHVALTRQVMGGQTRWVVTDLQSRNGLFVRVGKGPLVHQSEVLIGNGRYRLDLHQQAVAETAAFDQLNLRQSSNTRAFDNHVPIGSAVLTEVLASGVGGRVVLSGERYWIGSDPSCEICRPNDPFVSGKHACLSRSARGTWMLQHNQTLNGIWLRMPQVVLEHGKKCEFQIGEQRFRLRYGVPL